MIQFQFMAISIVYAKITENTCNITTIFTFDNILQQENFYIDIYFL